MVEKTENDILLEHMPALSIWYIALLTYLSQISIFLVSFIIFWLISSKYIAGSIIIQCIISFSGSLPYIYMAKNSEKIRNKYTKKYGKLASQYFWFKYHSYIIPLQSAGLYMPLLLVQYDFLPFTIKMPSHFITNNIFPYYVSIPLGVIITIFGIMIIKPSISYVDNVVGNRLHLIYPEKSELITNGIYKIIRNPQYLGRGVIAIGLGVFVNNVLAIVVGLIHFLSFYVIIPAEDKEMERRFGESFKKYKKSVPAILPRFKDLNNFSRLVLKRKTS